MQRTGTKVHQSSRVASQEEFVAQITERLLAVQKDRESLRREVREMMFRHASVTEVRTCTYILAHIPHTQHTQHTHTLSYACGQCILLLLLCRMLTGMTIQPCASLYQLKMLQVNWG